MTLLANIEAAERGRSFAPRPCPRCGSPRTTCAEFRSGMERRGGPLRRAHRPSFVLLCTESRCGHREVVVDITPTVGDRP